MCVCALEGIAHLLLFLVLRLFVADVRRMRTHALAQRCSVQPADDLQIGHFHMTLAGRALQLAAACLRPHASNSHEAATRTSVAFGAISCQVRLTVRKLA